MYLTRKQICSLFVSKEKFYFSDDCHLFTGIIQFCLKSVIHRGDLF